MKTEGELRIRLRSILEAEIAFRVSDAGNKLPHRCKHNHRQPLDSRKIVNGEPNEYYNRIVDARHLPLSQTIGLCMLGAENPVDWQGTICEEEIDAKKCPVFQPRWSESEIQAQFLSQLRTPGWVAAHMKEAHAILWALGEEDLALDAQESESFAGLLERLTVMSEPEPAPDPVPTPEPVVALVPVTGIKLPWWKRLLRYLSR